MPTAAQFARRTFRLFLAIFAIAILISCAPKKEKTPAPKPAATAHDQKKPTPTPSPSPTPPPAPTPQARYTATVKVDGVEVAQNEPLAAAANATPSPTPTATPSPSPTSKPKSAHGNFITNTWQKIFPPKPTPAPTPGATGGVTIRVSTPEGGESEQVVRAGSDAAAASAMPAPTPIKIKLRPSEGFFARMWHKIFPKKQEPPVAAPPQWIGTIKLINERDGYALIDSPSSFFAPVGETLNSVGSDSESGVLKASADRNPPFFIADIVSGHPRPGDRVYSPKP